MSPETTTEETKRDQTQEEDGTMIGVEVDGNENSQMKMVVGRMEPRLSKPIGERSEEKSCLSFRISAYIMLLEVYTLDICY